MPSGVFAFNPTQSFGIPSNSATCVRIVPACGPIFGASRINDESMLLIAYPASRTRRLRFPQKHHRVRALPLRIRGRKQRPDIRSPDRSQQRIGDRVQQHVAIGVPAQALAVRQCHTADLERNAALKFMRIPPKPDACRRLQINLPLFVLAGLSSLWIVILSAAKDLLLE